MNPLPEVREAADHAGPARRREVGDDGLAHDVAGASSPAG
jgi:hypothetical protein